MVEWARKSQLKSNLLLIASAKFPERERNHLAIELLWFMVLVLIKGMKRGGGSKVSLCHSRGLRASPQTYRERGGVI